MLELLDCEVQGGERVPQWDGRGGAAAAQGSGQGAVQLDHHQRVQHLLHVRRGGAGGQAGVAADLRRISPDYKTSEKYRIFCYWIRGKRLDLVPVDRRSRLHHELIKEIPEAGQVGGEPLPVLGSRQPDQVVQLLGHRAPRVLIRHQTKLQVWRVLIIQQLKQISRVRLGQNHINTNITRLPNISTLELLLWNDMLSLLLCWYQWLCQTRTTIFNCGQMFYHDYKCLGEPHICQCQCQCAVNVTRH